MRSLTTLVLWSLALGSVSAPWSLGAEPILGDHAKIKTTLQLAAITLYLTQTNGNVRGAQLFAGHARPETTMRYDRARRGLSDHGSYALAGRLDESGGTRVPAGHAYQLPADRSRAGVGRMVQDEQFRSDLVGDCRQFRR